jgi:NTE family protein
MTTVGLKSGALKYVTENGWLVDDPKSEVGALLVDPIQGMIASASIPAWFEVQKMGTERFVDGGISQEVPIRAAVEMGASQVFAVVSPIPLKNTNAITGLVDIAVRAATDITIDEITGNDLEPYGGWGVPVHVIRATVEVEGSRTIDPGLIRINMAYGWMRAFDVLSAFHPGAPDVSQNSDMIASLRKDIWDAENTLHTDARNVNCNPEWGPDPSISLSINRSSWCKRWQRMP